MTTSEFISNMQSKGVDVLFNQASTGYVSGICYSYRGMTIQAPNLEMISNVHLLKTQSTMNKKEIAQQFTKQRTQQF